MGVHQSLCRLCPAYCPILVEVADGRAVSIAGNPEAGFHGGYTCPKGRALPEQHYGSDRLLNSLKKSSGGFEPIPSGTAMDEIAAKVSELIALHGPRSVAFYGGMGGVPQPNALVIGGAWMKAIGSPMSFSAGSIDKPGILIAQALHGCWVAGERVFHEADAWIIVGANPVISKGAGFVMQNPGKLLKDGQARGVKLVVIDPRRTETAKRATIHLQPPPGFDPAILACLINIILKDECHDMDFVASNATGLEALAAAIAPFTPEMVAESTGVPEADLIAAAHIYAEASRAGISFGTGPSFATHGTLSEYLGLCLTTLCGHWRRAGDPVVKPNVLMPAYQAKAQPYPPYPPRSAGEQLRVRGLGACSSGLSAAALADEMLIEGDGRVRALICMGSNPMMSLPDQHKAFEALSSLDLLVTLAYEMNATARIADYVIAPRLTLETPGTTWISESAKYIGTNRGLDRPFAQYSPKIVDPPEGSDVIDDWEFFYGLAQRQGLQLEGVVGFGVGEHHEHPPTRFELDMVDKPSHDELLELIHADSRISLNEIKRHPNGRIYDDIGELVLPRDPDNVDRLELGDPSMMAELAAFLEETRSRDLSQGGQYPFLLISRRINNVLNSAYRSIESLNRKGYNPLCLNPSDIERLGLATDEIVAIRSRQGTILGIAEPDPTLRPGVVSMTQGFGGNPGEDDDPRSMGSHTGRLVSVDIDYDPITGIPRMGGIPVSITRVPSIVEEVDTGSVGADST